MTLERWLYIVGLVGAVLVWLGVDIIETEVRPVVSGVGGMMIGLALIPWIVNPARVWNRQ